MACVGRTAVAASVLWMSVMLSSINANNTTYYVDASAGADANAGTSQSAAWQTLGKVSGSSFLPGDRILFKSGQSWTGQLTVNGSGSAGNVIRIGGFGAGAKPKIIGGAGVSPIISIDNRQYIEINGLEVTHSDQTRSGRKIGISLGAGSAGTVLRNIAIRNCYLHHITSAVNSDNSLRYTGGIIPRSAKYDSLIIENNRIEDCYAGIYFAGGGAVRELPPTQANGSSNVTVQWNTVKRGQGDGIVIANCYNAKVQYNFVDSCCQNGSLAFANIWGSWLTNCVYQFNESGHAFPNADAEAFDDDWQCSGDTFQYNYGHDNRGGFFLLCSANYRTPNPTLRYNISQNDNWAYCECGNSDNLFVYNNVFYGIEANIKNGNYGLGSWFRNNIFYNSTRAITYRTVGTVSTGFDNNCYFQQGGTTPTDPHKLVADPMFVNAGGAPRGTGTATLMATLQAAYAAYQLKLGSPCINQGLIVAQNGGRDFGGATFNGAPDIGACEFGGVTSAFSAGSACSESDLGLRVVETGAGLAARLDPRYDRDDLSIGIYGIDGRSVVQRHQIDRTSGAVQFGHLSKGFYVVGAKAGERTSVVPFSVE